MDKTEPTLAELTAALKQARDALASVPRDAIAVMAAMNTHEDLCYPAYVVAETAMEQSGLDITEKRTLEIMRSLRVFGLAKFGRIFRVEEPSIAGSGYWLTPAGTALANLNKLIGEG